MALSEHWEDLGQVFFLIFSPNFMMESLDLPPKKNLEVIIISLNQTRPNNDLELAQAFPVVKKVLLLRYVIAIMIIRIFISFISSFRKLYERLHNL